MVSDVTSPAFNVEGRQWRSSVIEVFNYYFSALWADPCVSKRSLLNNQTVINNYTGRSSGSCEILVSSTITSPFRNHFAVLE
jgi:hypothetical protein